MIENPAAVKFQLFAYDTIIAENLSHNGATAGLVCSSAWTPFQLRGVALAQVDDATMQAGDLI